MILDLQGLFDDAPCGYLVVDADGMLVAVNRTFAALIGLDLATLVGRTRFVDLLTSRGRTYHETHLVPTLQMHGTVRTVALDLRRADGSRLLVLVNADLITDENSGASLTRVVVVDVTETSDLRTRTAGCDESCRARTSRCGHARPDPAVDADPDCAAADSPASTSPRFTDPPGPVTRSAATSTTCSRWRWTSGSWSWAMCRARARVPGWALVSTDHRRGHRYSTATW